MDRRRLLATGAGVITAVFTCVRVYLNDLILGLSPLVWKPRTRLTNPLLFTLLSSCEFLHDLTALPVLGEDAAALPVLEHAHRLNPADAQTADVLEKLRVGCQKQ